jgi:hypothetical protein
LLQCTSGEFCINKITGKSHKIKAMKNNKHQERNSFFTAALGASLALSLLMSSCKENGVDPVVVDPPLPPAAVVLQGRINADLVLEDLIADPNLPDYIANSDVELNARLTIRPGVVIAMAQDAQFTIYEDKGVILAQGTADKVIRFIGQQPRQGFWVGMSNFSESSANVLDYVYFQHTGSKPMLNNKKMALALTRETQMSVKHCVFADNAGYGMYVQGGAVLKDFSENTFKGNAEAGIIVPTELVSKLDEKSTFTGSNGRNVVEITGSYIGQTGEKNEIAWAGFADKTPYRILETVAVRTGWKLAPGATLEIARDEMLIIDEDAYLIAAGTEAKKVTFKGVEDGPAQWKGMLIHSTSNRNVLEYADFTGGGSITIIDGEKANIALYGDGARINIRNSKISGSGGYGIYVGSGSSVNTDYEKTTTFADNAQGNVINHNH